MIWIILKIYERKEGRMYVGVCFFAEIEGTVLEIMNIIRELDIIVMGDLIA
jgi:hypothetical protein